MTEKDILGALAQGQEEVKQRYKAKIKGFCGSQAKGETKTESDLDVLVEFDENADLFHFVGFSLFLEKELHCPVDMVPEGDIRPELKEEILREAVYLKNC